MATIQDYLEQIKNAIYGKDVRQAIHDGIEQCYKDGKAGSIDLIARQQIAELVAPSGEAPSAAEVTDARVGADGTSYTSLGDAIRTQTADLKSGLDKVIGEIGTRTAIPLYGTNDGWKLAGNGLCTSDSTATLKKYKVEAGEILYLRINKETAGTFQFQKDSGVPATGTNANLIGSAYANGIDGYIIVPTGATYLITSQLISNTSNKVQKYTINIDDSMSELQANFETVIGKNLFNKDDAENLYGVSKTNCYVMDSNGNPYNSTGSDSNYSVSCFVPVEEGRTIYFSFANGQTYAYQLALFDSSKQFISMTTWVDHYTIPSGVSYIRVSAVQLPNSFQIEYGARTSYVPYSATIYLNGVKVHSDDVASASEFQAVFETVIGKNLFNKDDAGNLYGISNSNCFVMDSNGVPYNSTASDSIYSVSCFVPVIEGKTVYFRFRGGQTYAYQLALFNKSKQFISMSTWVDHYTIPSGTAYIRVTAVKLHDQFQIEYDARTSYEAYSQTIYLNGVKVRSNDVVMAQGDYLVLPDKFYGVQNKEYDIFLKNVIVGNYNKFIVGKSGTGEQLSRRIRYIVSSAGTTNTSITLYDDTYNEIQTKNISYVNANLSAHSGETLKVLVIGDSFINSGYVTSGMINDFENDVATLQLLGTLGTSPNLHEGRSGWSSYEYTHESSVGSVSNPFINSGEFNFSHYISANNISTPDYVIINLGINDGWKDMHGTTTAENLQTMIDSIHDYNSAIKVIIGTTPSPYLGDAENGYLAYLLTNRKRQMLTRNVLENITESANTIICPIHLNFDTDYNFSMTTIVKNGENSETVPYCADDTHPSHMGFYQIADSYYACIKAN